MIFMVVHLSRIWAIEYGLLLLHICLPREVHALIHCDVHFFDKDAVCRNSISLLDIYHIPDHKISNLNAGACAISPSVNGHHLIIDFILQLQVL